MTHGHPANQALHDQANRTELLCARIARSFGTVRYLAVQTVFVLLWIAYNITAMRAHWHGWAFDPYPFILLNLAFSTQASYAAPIILFAQRRQEEHDRIRAETDHEHLTQLRAVNRAQTRILRRLDRLVAELHARGAG